MPEKKLGTIENNSKDPSSDPKDYLSLVKYFYRTKKIRPLSKALAEASNIWKKRDKI